jgi:hypothetical protein
MRLWQGLSEPLGNPDPLQDLDHVIERTVRISSRSHTNLGSQHEQ